MRILLVEDDPSTAQAITAMLRKEDWVIDSTDLGEDGLDLGKIYDYDLIILDLMLPDMDGMDVIRQLRSSKIATPVLILSGLQEADKKVQVGRLSVNLEARTAEVDDSPLHLTGKEYGILELLALRKGTTLTKEQFLNHLYGGMDEPELKIIDVFICKLRKKLATATGGESYIETVWGRGYVLRENEAAEAAPAVKKAVNA